jgi:hypothetical protein
MNAFTRHIIVIAACFAVLFTVSACSDLERLVNANGYIPLSELDLIQLNTDKKTTSALSLMGTTVPANSLKKNIVGIPYLKAVTNPLHAPYVFDIQLTPGPDELTRQIEGTLSVNLIKLKSWVNIGLSGSFKNKVSLPGLVFGIRGRMVTADNLGTLKETELPGIGKSLTTPFTMKNNAPLTLIISRISTSDVKFAIAELAGAEGYKSTNNEWKKEVPNKTATIATLEPASEVKEEEENNGTTRVIIVKRTLSNISLVVFLAVMKNDGAYILRGYAYNVTSEPLAVENIKKK